MRLATQSVESLTFYAITVWYEILALDTSSGKIADASLDAVLSGQSDLKTDLLSNNIQKVLRSKKSRLGSLRST